MFIVRIAADPDQTVLADGDAAARFIFNERDHAALLADDSRNFLAAHADDPPAADAMQPRLFHRHINQALRGDIDNLHDHHVADGHHPAQVIRLAHKARGSILHVQQSRICRRRRDAPAGHGNINNLPDNLVTKPRHIGAREWRYPQHPAR